MVKSRTPRFSLESMAEVIVASLLNSYDFFCIISGDRGNGKSTLAYQLAFHVRRVFRRMYNSDVDTLIRYYKLVKEPNGISFERFVEEITELKSKGAYLFNPKKQLLYSQDETLEFLQSWQQIGIMDEMVNVTFSRDFYQEKQKNIIKLLNLNRDHNHLIFSCVPKFTSLDNQVRNLSRMHIHVLKRGMSVVLTPNRLITSKDMWDTYVNERIERDHLKMKKKSTFAKLTTFRGMMTFPKLQENSERKYQAIKDAKRSKIASEEMNIGSDIKKPPIDILYEDFKAGKVKNIDNFDGLCVGYGLDLEGAKRKIRANLKKERQFSTKLKDYFQETMIAPVKSNMFDKEIV